MRVLLALALVAGCTRHNTTTMCTAGEQRQCACLGGGVCVQICNAGGTGLGDCLGCVGLDLSLADFAGADLTQSVPDLAGIDLAGADLSAAGDDLAVSLDLSVAPDLSVAQDFAV